jgi:hypothetical protein
MVSKIKIAVSLAVLLTGIGSGMAQQTTPAPSPDSPSQSQPKDAAQTPDATTQPQPPGNGQGNARQNNSQKGKIEGTSNDRLFYALPNFLTLENAGKVPPLTTKQKYAVVAEGAFDPVEIPWFGLLAGLGQAQNSEPRYGQGAAGYGKRYATSAADGLIENFMVGATLPGLLHQDPRYFQKGQGGFFNRTYYAASRMVITRTDRGKTQFNYSEIVGGMLSAALSTFTYHPTGGYISKPTNPHYFVASDRTLGNTASVWASQLGYDTLTAVVKEFWPDIHRKISPKYRRESTHAGE